MYCHSHRCHISQCCCGASNKPTETSIQVIEERLAQFIQEFKDELKDYSLDLKKQLFDYVDNGLNPIEISNSINGLEKQDTYILKTLTQRINDLNRATDLSIHNLRARIIELEKSNTSIIRDLTNITQRIIELENKDL